MKFIKLLIGGGKNALLKPFEQYCAFVVLQTLLLGGIYTYHYLLKGELRLSLLLLNFFYAYGITLLCSIIFNRHLRHVAMVLVTGVSFAFFCVTSYCHHTLQVVFATDFAAVILGTNVNETGEFLSTFVTADLLVFILCATFVVLAVSYLVSKLTVSRRAAIVLLIVAMASSVFYKTDVFENSILVFKGITTPPNLKEYERDVAITKRSGNQPSKIVLIIGESHTSTHNSLTGYGKPTNPQLEALRDSGSLYVFPNVISPACHTIASFKYLMSTMCRASQNQDEWYTYTTLPYIMRRGGYQTLWLSNQSKRGLNENVIGNYSELCDTSVFIGNAYSGLERTGYDGDLIEATKKQIKDNSQQQFFVIHLMGSHPAFRKRYPASSAYFKESDYASAPEHQRKTLAEYDNSVRYTDYVVSSIFKLFSSTDCIAIYISDHGVDLYDTRDDYAGHGVDANPDSYAAATKVPFLIYASDTFKTEHTEIVQSIATAKDEAFCTEDIIYTLMYCAMLDFQDCSVAKKMLSVEL